MKRTVNAIVGALILLMAFYTITRVIQIIFGWTETTFQEILIPLLIIIGYFIYMVIRATKTEKVSPPKETEIKYTVNNNKETLRYIITASENVCDTLAKNLTDHPQVISIFENSGNWYTNGETGAEWFTVTIEAERENKEAIEELVSKEIKHRRLSISNAFWS